MRGFRQKAAYWLNTGALVLLVLSVLFFIWMWGRAYIEGGIPQGAWGQYEGNHGPWRHIYNLRAAWWQILGMLSYTFVLGFISMLFKPSKRAIIATCSAFVLGFLFFATYYWLVD